MAEPDHARGSRLWDRVAQLADSAPSWSALRANRLHLLAARVRHERGDHIPEDIRDAQYQAAVFSLAVPPLLARAREAYDGRLLLMKGAEAAVRYPDRLDRPFRDLDILVDDPDRAQGALIASGFVELGEPREYAGAQHLAPLYWPGLPLLIEIHRWPSRPPWLPAVAASSVFAHSIPSQTGAAGILTAHAAAHALLLTAHSWSHEPLGRLADLVDVAATLDEGDRAIATEIARSWGWERMWQVTLRATDAVVFGDHAPKSLVLWGRHLHDSRDRTVLEGQIARLLAPAWTLPPSRTPRGVAGAARRLVSRRRDEPWSRKLKRTRMSLAHALMDKSEHDRRLSFDQGVDV